MDKFYITTPIYYVTDKPHLGHAFTTVYADVLARFWRQKVRDVFFLTGTDEHGSKIAEKAEKEGKSPQKLVDDIAKHYENTWKKLNIAHDEFIRTTSEKHEKGVAEFFKKLNPRDIYKGDYEGLYCIECERSYTEKELVNGLCPDHLIPPQRIKEKNYFFNLKKYLPIIRKKVEDDEIKILPPSRKKEVLNIIDSDLPDFSVSREKVKWGIPYPGDNSQTIYVWVEALMNYVTALDFPSGKNFKKFWPADIHLIGADISKFHSIFWPALLISADLPLPKNIFVHGFFTVNGQKMSKTIGNVIDQVTLVEKFGSDATRYLLLSQFPATEHGDIKVDDFAGKYNSDLANGVGNIAERILAMLLNTANFRYDVSTKNIDPKIRKLAEDVQSKYDENFENYNLFEALRIVFAFVKELDRYINEKEPWRLSKKGVGFEAEAEGAIILNSLFFGIERIVGWLQPFMPLKAREAQAYIEKIKKQKITKDGKLNLFPRLK